jgi:hypothetical protein
MSAQNDNDRLDDLIFHTINTEKPEFDAEKWKQKYPDEYQTLISRREKAVSPHQPKIWRIIFGKPLIQLAAAAAVIVVVGLLLSLGKQNPNAPAANPELNAQSPAKIISMASMRMAYQQGGMDALDKQFRDTLDVLGPRSSSVSIQELLKNSNMF